MDGGAPRGAARRDPALPPGAHRDGARLQLLATGPRRVAHRPLRPWPRLPRHAQGSPEDAPASGARAVARRARLRLGGREPGDGEGLGGARRPGCHREELVSHHQGVRLVGRAGGVDPRRRGRRRGSDTDGGVRTLPLVCRRLPHAGHRRRPRRRRAEVSVVPNHRERARGAPGAARLDGESRLRVRPLSVGVPAQSAGPAGVGPLRAPGHRVSWRPSPGGDEPSRVAGPRGGDRADAGGLRGNPPQRGLCPRRSERPERAGRPRSAGRGAGADRARGGELGLGAARPRKATY